MQLLFAWALSFGIHPLSPFIIPSPPVRGSLKAASPNTLLIVERNVTLCNLVSHAVKLRACETTQNVFRY